MNPMSMTFAGAAACAFAVLGLPLQVQAQVQDDAAAPADHSKAHEILSRCHEAMGGEAWDDVESMSFTTVPPAELMGDVKITGKAMRPDKIRCDATFGEDGGAFIVTNGDAMWAQGPGEEVELIDQSDEPAMLLRVFAPQPFLFMAHHFFPTVEAGEEEFGGAACQCISASTEDDAASVKLFFNAETGLFSGFRSSSPDGGEDVVFTVNEWKNEGERSVITKCTLEVQGTQGVFEYRDFAFNTVDATVFDIPEEVKAAMNEDDEDDDDDEQEDDGDDDDVDDDDGGV